MKQDEETSHADGTTTKSPVYCTPKRSPVSKEIDNGSPASSVLASSLPLAELMYEPQFEVDSDSPNKNDTNTEGLSTSRLVNSFFKKNHSKEESPATLEETALSESPVATETIGTACNEKALRPETNDDCTIKTESSGSDNLVDLAKSGWVVDDVSDLEMEGDPNQESRCGDCGVSQQLHDQLIMVGGCIYSLVGRPSNATRVTMEEMGDLFADEDVSEDGSESCD